MTCDNPRCQHEFCWLCLYEWISATHFAALCTVRAETSLSEVLASVERQIRSNWAQQVHDTRPEEDIYAEEVLQRFRAAFTTRIESDAELLSGEDADVPCVRYASQSSMIIARVGFVPLRRLCSLV